MARFAGMAELVQWIMYGLVAGVAISVLLRAIGAIV